MQRFLLTRQTIGLIGAHIPVSDNFLEGLLWSLPPCVREHAQYSGLAHLGGLELHIDRIYQKGMEENFQRRLVISRQPRLVASGFVASGLSLSVPTPSIEELSVRLQTELMQEILTFPIPNKDQEGETIPNTGSEEKDFMAKSNAEAISNTTADEPPLPIQPPSPSSNVLPISSPQSATGMLKRPDEGKHNTPVLPTELASSGNKIANHALAPITAGGLQDPPSPLSDISAGIEQDDTSTSVQVRNDLQTSPTAVPDMETRYGAYLFHRTLVEAFSSVVLRLASGAEMEGRDFQMIDKETGWLNDNCVNTYISYVPQFVIDL